MVHKFTYIHTFLHTYIHTYMYTYIFWGKCVVKISRVVKKRVSRGWNQSGSSRSPLLWWPRSILSIRIYPKNRRKLLPSVQLSPQKRGRGRRGCHGAIVPAGNALLDGLRPPQMPCTQHSQAWGILETIWSRHTRPLHTEGNLEQPGADSGR